MTVQRLPPVIDSIFVCCIKYSVILDLLMSPGRGTYDFGWLLHYLQIDSRTFRSKRGKIIRVAAIKQFIVTMMCSTCYSIR